MVSLEAPKMEEDAERAPLNISAVIDESGSMSGEKIEFVRASLHKMLDHLTERDRMGLIGFTRGVREIMAPALMTTGNKEKFRAAIDTLEGRLTTNLSGGLFRGLEQMIGGVEGALNRIMLFTDGLANEGVTGIEQLSSALLGSLKSHAVKNITVSCFGYGQDVSTEFLETLARVGKGNYYHIDKPDNAPRAFAKELGSLLSTFAQNIRVELLPKTDVELLEVLNDFDVTPEGDKTVVAIDDILSEEKRHVVVKLKVPALTNGVAARPFKACDVVVIYHNAVTGEQCTNELKAKIEAVKAEDVQTKPDPDVEEQIAILKTADAVAQATIAADQGDYARAAFVMQEVQSEIKGTQAFTAGSEIAQGLFAETQVLCNSVSNQQTYAATSNSVRAARTSYGRGRSTSGKKSFFDNSTQRGMVEDFEDSAAGTPAPSVASESSSAVEPPDDGNSSTAVKTKSVYKTRKSKRGF